jgi:hypothetical protein
MANCSDTTTITYVASDDLLDFVVYAKEFAHALRYIAVACAVETITTHAVFLVELVRKGIHV